MTTHTCPECQMPLGRRKTTLGLVWVCPVCRGRAITLQMVRRAVPQDLVNRLWQQARAEGHARKRPCPACRQQMVAVPIVARQKTEYLDVCTRCHFVWFDHQEFAALPKIPQPAVVQEKPLSPEAREALALARLKIVKQTQQAQGGADEGPDDWWQVGIALLGVPVEHNDTPLANRPWATWLTTALIALVSILAFQNLGPIVNDWGLVPAEFTRHWGLTFVTSFFLHAGIAHLLSNLYFLWIFGDNTEDALGTGRFLLLLVLAAILGRITIAKVLIAHGAAINASANGETPLSLAASRGQTEMVKFLLDEHAAINTRNNHEETPLHVALVSRQEGLRDSAVLRRPQWAFRRRQVTCLSQSPSQRNKRVVPADSTACGRRQRRQDNSTTAACPRR